MSNEHDPEKNPDLTPQYAKGALIGKLRETLAYLSGLSHFNNLVISEPALRAAKGHMYVVQAAIDALAPAPTVSTVKAGDSTIASPPMSDHKVPPSVVSFVEANGAVLVNYKKHDKVAWKSGYAEIGGVAKATGCSVQKVVDENGRVWHAVVTSDSNRADNWYFPTYLTIVQTPKPAPLPLTPLAHVPQIVVDAMRRGWSGVYYPTDYERACAVEAQTKSPAQCVHEHSGYAHGVLRDPQGRAWDVVLSKTKHPVWFFPTFNHAWPA